jgi:thiol:disulfide interchange protein DsbD
LIRTSFYKLSLVSLITLLSLISLTALNAQEARKPAEVFRYDAYTEGSLLIIEWDIEEGYYLYRDKLAFTTDAPGINFADPVFPAGEIHADEFFGEQVIYRDEQKIIVPILNKPAGIKKFQLQLTSQGCADYGLCYPPQNWTTKVRVNSPPIIDLRPTQIMPGKQAMIPGAPLPVQEAFLPSLATADAFTLLLSWEIEPGYYLYRDSFAFRTSDDQVQLGAARYPQGVMEMDAEFGATEVYYDSVEIRIPLSRATPDPHLLELEISYQGCKKGSICYPPEIITLPVDLPLASNSDLTTELLAPVSEQARLSNVVADANLATLMLIFLGAGLLLSFTPCCLPMVPILSGIIAGQGNNVTTSRAFWLSLSYVLGMAFTYTIAGAVFGAAGTQIQAVLQTPVVIGGVTILFVALALAMFGVYELQMPAALQTRLTTLGNNQKIGGFFGVAAMGAVSALVVSTCVAPPLVAALTVIAQTGDVARGALALFSMAIGMGIPLLIIGTSAGKLLPKAGPWMNTIKAIFGFMMLALAAWMLGRLIPASATMGLYAAIVILAGIRFGAFTALPAASNGVHIIGKGVAIVLLIYGGTLVVGLLSGSTNPLQPLQRVSGKADTRHLEFERIKSVADFESARQRAAEKGVPLMLDFYADWCVSCKEMEYYTFTDPRVQTALSEAILIQADVTANDETDQQLLQYFGIFGPPTIVYFDRSGKEIEGQRVIGYMDADAYLRHLNYVLK